jgi:hypothetical protein
MSTGKFIECYYGQSGTGKSESIAAIIRKIYQETGKTSRVLIGDGSGATYQALVEAGIVEMMDYTIRDWPLSTMSNLCEGYWPQDALDPKSKMVPMTAEQFAKLGVYGIEGLSVAANYVMGDKKGAFAERAGRGEKIGQDSPIMLCDQERFANGQLDPKSGPGTLFGGNSLAHYGVAQKRILGFVEKSKGLPGWVIWTAHERSAEDKVSNEKMIGPEVAGGALTASLSRHFNNTLHFATAVKTVKEKDAHTEKAVDVIDTEYRIYTRDHFRAEGTSFTKYKAVTRHPDPNGKLYKVPLPLFFESDTPGASIVALYQNIKEARTAQIAALKVPAEVAA